MLAERIALEKNSPLWDLGAVQVGHGFATGTVAGAFGDDLFSKIAGELRQGERVIVFDALDEGRLRAGEANFEGFLDGIVERFSTPRRSSALVLLGREDSITWADLWLNDKGVTTARYDIEYFDQEGSQEFIEKYLANLPPTKIRAKESIRTRSEFLEARDAVLKRLADCVPEAPEPVVGYAPVLIVVSEYLNEGNPHGLLQKVMRWNLQDPAQLLAQVARELLEREHTQKIGELLPNALNAPPSFSAWEKLYTPDEQCLRLLAIECKYNLAARPPSELPPALRNDYENAIKPWLDDHPFAGQQVFREYVYAWLLRQEGVEPNLRDAVRRRLTAPETKYLPSRLLADFLVARRGGDTINPASVEAKDFGLLHESVMAGCTNGEVVRLTLLSGAPGTPIEGEIAWLVIRPDNPSEGEKSARRLPLILQNSEAGIWFWRRLAHATVQVSVPVQLGLAAHDFILGPDVDIECEAFACKSPALRVIAGDEGHAVTIAARTYGADDSPTIIGRPEDRGEFRVSWELMRYPWVANRFAAQESVTVTPRIREAVQKFRRILVFFRAEGHDDIARSVELIENRAVAGTGLARDVLEFCLKKRLISRGPNFYLLNRAAMDRRAINWRDINTRNLSPAIAEFFKDF